MRVKICGLTQTKDAQLAWDLGATELGFIFAPSPRQISLETAKSICLSLPSEARVVGVFVDEKNDVILDVAQALNLKVIQLHGNEKPDDILYIKSQRPDLFVMKVISVGKDVMMDPLVYQASDAFLFDSIGSHFSPEERKPIENKNLKELTGGKPFYLAGGLNASNLLERIERLRPQGIDISSGVEKSPGIKDEKLMREIFSLLKDMK
jgi:phosphoribosylanthranilate isomerase